VDRATRVLRFNTDVRSTKYREMQGQPTVSILGYDPAAKLQLRLRGQAALHQGDDVAKAAWSASQPQSLMCYRQPEAPSAVTEGALPAPDMRGMAFKAEDGFQNFAVVSIEIRVLEWLFLSRLGHQRIRFSYDERGGSRHEWLAP
jgi:pyridoxamine 5'-phosphate oxidase